MGTNNYFIKNVSNYYTIDVDHCDEDKWASEDDSRFYYEQHFYEDLKLSFEKELQTTLKGYELLTEEQWDLQRNFCGQYIANKQFYFENKLLDGITIIVTPIIRGGYYQGCNLDFEVKIDFIDALHHHYGWDNKYNEFIDFSELEVFLDEDTAKHIPKNCKTIFKKAKEALKKEIKELEIFYKKFSDNYWYYD